MSIRERWRLRSICTGIAVIAFIVLTASPFDSPTGSISVLYTDQYDGSWMWSLTQIFKAHIKFGPNFIYTYGPLGFLDVNGESTSRTFWLISVAVKGVTEFSICLILLAILKQVAINQQFSIAKRWLIGVVITPIVIDVLNQNFTFLLSSLIALFAIIHLQGIRKVSRNHNLLAYALGPLLAIDCLVKSSVIAYCIVVLIVLVVLTFVRKNEGVKWSIEASGVILSFLISFCLLWLLTGQTLTDIPEFLYYTLQITIGYSSVFTLAGSTAQIVELILLIGFTTAGLLVLPLRNIMVESTPASTSRKKFVTYLLSGLVLLSFAFINWKEGIVRQDLGHVSIAFASFALVVVLFAVLASTITKLYWVSVPLLIASVALLININPQIITAVTSGANATYTTNGMRLALNGAKNNEAISTALSYQRSISKVPQEMLDKIGTQNVVILPSNLVIGPAYGLHEVFAPDEQLSQDYTPALDELDAKFVAANKAPWVLLEYDTPLAFYEPWMAPDTFRSLFTNYSIAETSTSFTLLHWEPHHVVTTLETRRNVAVDSLVSVPSCARGTTTATFDFKESPLSSIASDFFRPAMITLLMNVVFADGRSQAIGTNLVWNVASDGLDMTNMPTSGTSWTLFGSTLNYKSQVKSFVLYAPRSFFSRSSSIAVSYYCSVRIHRYLVRA